MRIRKDKEGLEPIRFATDLEVAWAAGIYEGEGCCVINGNGKRSFNVSVSQKDPELLYRLRDLFGGTVKDYSNSRGTFLAKKNRTLTIYAWRLCGDKARIFLTAVYPFLTARRKAQIDRTVVIHFREFAGPLPGSDFIPYLNSVLQEWIRSHRATAKQSRSEYQKRFYEQRKADPTFMEKRRQMTAAWRARQKAYQQATEKVEE